MFSYDINVRRLNNNSNLKAFVSVTVDGVMEIDGFKIVEGRNGLFVSVPSHKGSIMEEGERVDKYFDDIRFKGEPGKAFGDELKAAILEAYNSKPSDTSKYSSDNAKQKSNAANAKKEASKTEAFKTEENSSPPRARKPIWGF